MDALRETGSLIIISLGGLGLSTLLAHRGKIIQQYIVIGAVLVYLLWAFVLPQVDRIAGMLSLWSY